MLAKRIIDDLSRFFEGAPTFLTPIWGKKILGPLEKPLEIADYVFYCIKNGSERNSEHFNLPRNGSEQNYLVLSVFLRAFVYLSRNGSERNCSAKQGIPTE
jgi:hypothetical protein